MNYRPEPSAWALRQERMWEFVNEFDLACFKCDKRTPVAWAKTGTGAHGQWAICFECAAAYRRAQKTDAA